MSLKAQNDCIFWNFWGGMAPLAPLATPMLGSGARHIIQRGSTAEFTEYSIACNSVVSTCTALFSKTAAWIFLIPVIVTCLAEKISF